MAGAKTNLKQSDLRDGGEEDEDRKVIVEEKGGVTVDLDELNRDAEEAERRSKKGGAERDDGGSRSAGLDDEAARQESERKAEERREARRQERRDRKDNRRDYNDKLEREIVDLRTTVQTLADKTAPDVIGEARAQVANIDSEMERLARQYEQAKDVKRQALENRDESKASEAARAAVEADEAISNARDRYESLRGQRAAIVEGARREAARPKVSPQLQQHAKDFRADHPWYKQGSEERDSEQVSALDRQLASEGWNPNSAGYWEELRERVQEKLPHRFERNRDRGRDRDDDDDPAPRTRRTTPTGGGGRESGGGGGNTYHLSAERVSALKEAGMWDDPVKRNKMIRTYRQRDDQAARERNRN